MTGTVRFRFEYRLFDWAEAFSRDLCGARCAFLVALRDDATLRRVYLARPDKPFDGDQKTSMAGAHTRWVLFSPGDDAGQGYLEWLGLPESVARRWLGRAFEETDFQDVRTGDALEGWPESWRVVVR